MKTKSDRNDPVTAEQRRVLELEALLSQASELISGLARQCRDANDAAVAAWLTRRNQLNKQGTAQ